MLIQIIFALGLAQSPDAALKARPNHIADVSRRFDLAAYPIEKAHKVRAVDSRDVASPYAMPGLRSSFLPDTRWAPGLSGGAGSVPQAQSELARLGGTYASSRNAAGMYGGGLDLVTYKAAKFGFEAKDHLGDGRRFSLSAGVKFRWGK